MIEQITARIVPPNFICCVGASLFFKRGHALSNQCVHGGEVSAVDFANLLALLEQDKTWTAGQRSVLEFVFDFFWNERLVGTEEFQTKEVFVVPQMQSSVVHLHVVAVARSFPSIQDLYYPMGTYRTPVQRSSPDQCRT